MSNVSIALLTRNAGGAIRELLDLLWQQRTPFTYEIVAVDSGSTDDTVEALTGRVSKLVQIPQSSFNHGLTRNLAVEQCTGELIVFIVQDAIPLGDTWLTSIVAPLIADPTVAGAFARQRPRENASSITKQYLDRWLATSSTPRLVDSVNAQQWRELAPGDRFMRCVFDNVCSCIRRDAWIAHPFADTPIAEDIEWARDVLLDGWRVAYEPQAEVVHSHDRSATYEYRRTYLVHRRLYDLFDLRTIPTLLGFARAVGMSIASHLWWERRRPSAWYRGVSLGIAWPAGQYFGARSAVSRRRLPRWRPGTV